jgi:hypothetical protein
MDGHRETQNEEALMKRWRVFWPLLSATVAILLLANSHPGPDFGRYIDWANAFRSSDITRLGGDVLSPMRVPLSQWSFGPGLIFSMLSVLAPVTAGARAALFVGWVGALAFWLLMHRILVRVTGGDQSLTLFGLGLCFVSTQLGFYSTAIASETISYPCLALVVLAVVETDCWGFREALILSVPSALLLTIRPQLGVFAVAPLTIATFSILRQRSPIVRRLALVGALAVPLLVALTEIMMTNRWMTGSLLKSPYSFGGSGFKSIDLARPEIAAVLIHPWHGLLAYHPLFALLLVVPLLMAAETRTASEKFLLLAMSGATLIHLYLHASWYVWWMGLGSFGSRGMGISAVFLVPFLCKYVAERRDHPSTRILLALVLVATAWSALLLLQGNTQFYNYEQLWLAQVNCVKHLMTAALSQPILCSVTIVGLGTAGTWWWLNSNDSRTAGRHLALAAYGLTLFSLFYLARGSALLSRLASPRFAVYLFFAPVIGATSALIWRITRQWQLGPEGARLRSTIGTIFGAVFVVSTCLFIRLAIRTEVAISDRSISLDRFHFQSPIHVEEVEASYLEYLQVGGFDRKKDALRHFIVATKDVAAKDLELKRAAVR